ncbi:hypothetical protein AOXY_G8557 [Acipenser oxyrinchus oxyrinchus]|uniref:Uncharacterized protein n=1 Tax=Acipenser oxyrinchus oxyrinchus TaxID=40147 RepID=A0AAD8G825_ACIOX|nr:hypothetical protein AOXY_G8557 [Acipenser oxyrinchus oxyrinchus]
MNGLLIIICLTCTFARHVSPGEKAVIECDLQGASEIICKEKGEVMFGNGTQLTNEGLQDDGNKTNESQIKSKNCDVFFILTVSFSVILFLTFGGILLYCIKRKGMYTFTKRLHYGQCQRAIFPTALF